MEMTTETKLSMAALALFAIVISAWILLDAVSIGVLRVWAVVCTLLVPVTGYVAWTARGMLAKAEHGGLQAGMEHTLGVVKAVRPSREVQKETRREIMSPFAGLPAMPDPGAFEIMSGSGNVVDL